MNHSRQRNNNDDDFHSNGGHFKLGQVDCEKCGHQASYCDKGRLWVKVKTKRNCYDDILDSVIPCSPYTKGTSWLAPNPYFVSKKKCACKKQNPLRKNLSLVIVDNAFYDEITLEKERKKLEKQRLKEKEEKFKEPPKVKWYHFFPEETKRRFNNHCTSKSLLRSRHSAYTQKKFLEADNESLEENISEPTLHEYRAREHYDQHASRSPRPNKAQYERRTREHPEECFNENTPKLEHQRREITPNRAKCGCSRRQRPQQSPHTTKECLKEITPKMIAPKCELPRREITAKSTKRAVQNTEPLNESPSSAKEFSEDSKAKNPKHELINKIEPFDQSHSSGECLEDETTKKTQCEELDTDVFPCSTGSDNNSMIFAQKPVGKKLYKDTRNIECEKIEPDCEFLESDIENSEQALNNNESTCIESQSSSHCHIRNDDNSQKIVMGTLKANQPYPSGSNCRYEKEYCLNDTQNTKGCNLGSRDQNQNLLRSTVVF